MVKNLLACGRPGFDPWIGKIPWRKEWQPTPVFLPVKPHGQTSLVGYSPWGHKESDMTERLNRHTHTSPEKNLLKRTERREVHIDFHPGGGGI